MPGEWLYDNDAAHHAMADAGMAMIEGLGRGDRGAYINGWRAYERALRRRKRRLPRGEHSLAAALRFCVGPGGPPPQETIFDVVFEIYGRRLPGVSRWPTPTIIRSGVR